MYQAATDNGLSARYDVRKTAGRPRMRLNRLLPAHWAGFEIEIFRRKLKCKNQDVFRGGAPITMNRAAAVI